MTLEGGIPPGRDDHVPALRTQRHDLLGRWACSFGVSVHGDRRYNSQPFPSTDAGTCSSVVSYSVTKTTTQQARHR
jgi:hypothetical protein